MELFYSKLLLIDPLTQIYFFLDGSHIDRCSETMPTKFNYSKP